MAAGPHMWSTRAFLHTRRFCQGAPALRDLMNRRYDQLVAIEHAADFGVDRLVRADVFAPAFIVLNSFLCTLVPHQIEPDRAAVVQFHSKCTRGRGHGTVRT